MSKKVKITCIVIGILFQMVSVLLFGFTNIPISSGTYLLVFGVCTIMIQRFLQGMDIN